MGNTKKKIDIQLLHQSLILLKDRGFLRDKGGNPAVTLTGRELLLRLTRKKAETDEEKAMLVFALALDLIEEE